MFLSRMVSGLICSKSHNKNNQTNQPATKSPKSNKKTEKCKRSLSKTNSKMCISELLKSNVKENQIKESNINHNNNNSANNNNGAIGHGSNNPNNNIKTGTSMKPPTKVKSGSWKRSEKQISSYNTIAGKKSKTLRKRSPTWLKFPNSPVKIAEKVAYVGANEATSVCRPGTLYSDVLFGAGSSCLVKIKTLTPRRSTNTAQKKLTKALIKCSKSNETEGSGSEPETDREVFPSLIEFNKTAINIGRTGVGGGGGGCGLAGTSSNTCGEKSNYALAKTDDVADDGEAEDVEDSGADVVILSESNGVQNASNGYDDNTYGSYLENHFKQVNGTDFQRSSSGKPFTIDIPQWNFMDADISSEAYPKFLCQFEDEHYLKAEKMALLGLKLALGNNTHQGKFKF